MPRIDPLQLLKCLSVLLTKEGGILSKEEVPRLVSLMTKFSKKLVSKCVYVLILKSTETELVDMFMAEGGWALIQTWLQDAVQSSNWDLVREILGLLLITPVDVERLKLNILPKLIKSLSRQEELEGVAQLSTKLVQQWLCIVKGTSLAAQQAQLVQIPVEPQTVVEPATTAAEVEAAQPQEEAKINDLQETDKVEPLAPNNFYKSSDKDGKLVIRKMSEDEEIKINKEVIAEQKPEIKEGSDEKEKVKDDKSKSSSKSAKISGSSNKSSSSKNKDKKDKDKNSKDIHKDSKDKDSKDREKVSNGNDKDSKDRDKDRKKSSSTKSSSSSSNKSKDSSKEKDKKDKGRDKERDRHRSSSRGSSSSSSSKDKKESSRDKDKSKQAEKDKDTLDKIKPVTINKLGRIPKKSSSIPSPVPVDDKAEVKKKPFSVGIKKDSEDRPKTVKIFNSRMRSTGLEEDIDPAPPRPLKKPTPSVQLPTLPTKRPSPVKEIRDPIIPPEKKIKLDKIDVPERPGAIKLIPPKPKPMLQESDLFMDALTAATTKKEPKKRKRRPSVSKDSVTASPTSSAAAGEAPQTPTSPTGGNQLALKNIEPINFYQDTLSEETETKDDENKENTVVENTEEPSDNPVPIDNEEPKNAPSSPVIDVPSTPIDDEEVESKKPRIDGERRGVLLYTKKKGPKKSISWKAESDLVEVRYFELDENERVNVTRPFGDMARMEMSNEREAFMARKIVGEDLMEASTIWRVPYELDIDDPPAAVGYKSLEKDIQFAREKISPAAIYYDKRKIPDSPEEPIPEIHQICDPKVIPLEDPESQEIDMRGTPWPEPKGHAPQPEPIVPPQLYPNIPGNYNMPFNNINNMPPPQFQGVPPHAMPPRFPGPVGPVGNFGPPNMLTSGNMMPNGNMMNPPNMPPNEMINMNPNLNHMNPNMYPPGGMQDGYGPVPGPVPDFAMYGSPNVPNMQNQNVPPENIFPHKNFNNPGRGNRRGGFRRGGNSPNSGGNWVRMGGGNNWKRGGRGGRLCKHVQNHGYCRNMDTCPFIHP